MIVSDFRKEVFRNLPMAFAVQDPATRDQQLLRRAIALYEEEGMDDDAKRTKMMLDVIASD